MLLTTLPQELHGLGLLMVEAMLVLEGCTCVSLGTQTPLLDVVQAAQAHRVDVVLLSFSAAQNGTVVLANLRELRAQLPSRIALWVGGSCPALYHKPLEGITATLPALNGVLASAPATLRMVPRLAADIDGLIRPAVAVLTDLNPMLGYLAPYDRDLAAWLANFAQTLGVGDANGKAFRVMPVLNDQSVTGLPFSTNLGPLDRYNPMPAPGTGDKPGAYGSTEYPHVQRGQ